MWKGIFLFIIYWILSLLAIGSNLENRLPSVPVLIPFQSYMGQILIGVTLNGSTDTLNFLFDTGAEEMLLDVAVAEKYKYNPIADGLTQSAYGVSKINRGRLGRVSVGCVNIDSCDFTLMNLKQSGYGEKIDGIIGADILKHFVIEINNDQQLFLFYNNIKEINKLPSISMPFVFDNNHRIPQIQTSFTMKNEKRYFGRFFIDSGANIGIMLNALFIEENNLLNQVDRKMKMGVSDLNNEVSMYYGVIGSLAIGDTLFYDIPTFFPLDKSGVNGFKEYAGIIGNGILSRFNIIFDYENKMIYFVKNKIFPLPFFYPTSGIMLQKIDERIFVESVAEESDAYRLGLRKGYEILRINDLSNSDNFSQMQRLLNIQTEGTLIYIYFKNKTEQKEISLHLKRLI